MGTLIKSGSTSTVKNTLFRFSVTSNVIEYSTLGNFNHYTLGIPSY